MRSSEESNKPKIERGKPVPKAREELDDEVESLYRFWGSESTNPHHLARPYSIDDCKPLWIVHNRNNINARANNQSDDGTKVCGAGDVAGQCQK